MAGSEDNSPSRRSSDNRRDKRGVKLGRRFFASSGDKNSVSRARSSHRESKDNKTIRGMAGGSVIVVIGGTAEETVEAGRITRAITKATDVGGEKNVAVVMLRLAYFGRHPDLPEGFAALRYTNVTL